VITSRLAGAHKIPHIPFPGLARFEGYCISMSTEGLDFSKIPVQPAPLGVTSNFVDPHTIAGVVTATSAVFIVLSTAFVVLRVYTRLVLVHIFGVGDCMSSSCSGDWFVLTFVLDLLLTGYVCFLHQTCHYQHRCYVTRSDM
jgi:hypothetical protein